MANRNQTEVTTIDKLFYAPPFIIDVRQEGENDGLDDYSQNDLSGGSSDNPQAPQLPGSGAGPTVSPPVGFKVISQTVRIGPDGSSVVDVVLEFPDQNGVQSVDVRYQATNGVPTLNGGGTGSGTGASTPPASGGTTTPPVSTPTTTLPTAPTGPTGTWALAFHDEFDSPVLDTTKWFNLDGASINDVTTRAYNVSVANSNLVLTLADANNGAAISTNPSGWENGGFTLPVGGYVEARILFPGSGTKIYNWPAWWVSGLNWPAAGENDIAEGLGTLTVNYHSPSGSHNQGTIAGTWANAFHTYGLHRKAGSCDVYWDGVKVKTYTTDDNGAGESLILNVGNGNTAVYGTGSQMLVDWVRAWSPA